MDESTIRVTKGKPVPHWDALHRLPVDRPVGPDLWDGGTIFRINSVYMDVTEQPFMERQRAALGALLSLAGVGAAYWIYYMTHIMFPRAKGAIPDAMSLIALIFFGRLTYLAGRTVFFSLKSRPIRFNRKAGKIFAIRRRRFFRKAGEGDVVTEVDWHKNSVFCVHRETTNFGRVFHIRCYQVDAQGNVLDAFSIGREWQGEHNLQILLAQWNYWCRFMNEGPEVLPKPMLFIPTRETLSDTFFFSMYTFGFSASGTWRIITMPFTLLFTLLRRLSLATCRQPAWPDSLNEINRVDPGDSFAEPTGQTPVGWAPTIRAQQRGDYPDEATGEVSNWHGSSDGAENAKLWAADTPPKDLAGA